MSIYNSCDIKVSKNQHKCNMFILGNLYYIEYRVSVNNIYLAEIVTHSISGKQLLWGKYRLKCKDSNYLMITLGMWHDFSFCMILCYKNQTISNGVLLESNSIFVPINVVMLDVL